MGICLWFWAMGGPTLIRRPPVVYGRGPSGVRRGTLQSYNPIIIYNPISYRYCCISARMMGTQNPRIVPPPPPVISAPGPLGRPSLSRQNLFSPFKTIKNSWFYKQKPFSWSPNEGLGGVPLQIVGYSNIFSEKRV